MKIAIGSDRRGFITKEKLIQHMKQHGIDVIDLGPYDDLIPVDYPIYGEKVGSTVVKGEADFGVVICATGNGILMAANKVKGVRCGMAYSDDVAHLMREHNNANVICFGQDYMDYKDIERRLDIFLDSGFLGDYHCSRVKQLEDIENNIPIFQSEIINPAFKKR